MTPSVIIHGGFFSESATNLETKIAKQNSLLHIINLAAEFLLTHSAVETVVYAVALLEDDTLFNAGTGSQIQADGKIRMSASLMDGDSKKFSGVINIQDIKNPILLAEILMNEEDRVLASAEALNFAKSKSIPFYNPEIPARRADYERKLQTLATGTVGCVALDKDGKIAAATSTGGKGFEIPGRVSDSATTAGNFANQHAGISCTGVGEDIVSAALASSIVNRVSDGLNLQAATEKTFSEMKEFDGFGGIIGISANGEIFHKDSFPYMVYAYSDGKNEPVVFG